MSGYGFHRQTKLHNGAEFRCVFDAPDRSSDALFTVLAKPNGRGYARLGMAIGRKRIRHAVVRNKLKRLIRESFRHHPDLLQGLDLVVMARFDGKTENNRVFHSLKKHWNRLARRLISEAKGKQGGHILDAGFEAGLKCQ